MGIKAAFRSYLLADPSIAAAVGTRINPAISSTVSEVPRIVYTCTGSEDFITMKATSSLRKDRFNISILANSSDQCDLIAELCRARMATCIQTGGMDRIFFQGQSESYQFQDGMEKPVYEVILSVEIAYYG